MAGAGWWAFGTDYMYCMHKEKLITSGILFWFGFFLIYLRLFISDIIAIILVSIMSLVRTMMLFGFCCFSCKNCGFFKFCGHSCPERCTLCNAKIRVSGHHMSLCENKKSFLSYCINPLSRSYIKNLSWYLSRLFLPPVAMVMMLYGVSGIFPFAAAQSHDVPSGLMDSSYVIFFSVLVIVGCVLIMSLYFVGCVMFHGIPKIDLEEVVQPGDFGKMYKKIILSILSLKALLCLFVIMFIFNTSMTSITVVKQFQIASAASMLRASHYSFLPAIMLVLSRTAITDAVEEIDDTKMIDDAISRGEFKEYKGTLRHLQQRTNLDLTGISELCDAEGICKVSGTVLAKLKLVEDFQSGYDLRYVKLKEEKGISQLDIRVHRTFIVGQMVVQYTAAQSVHHGASTHKCNGGSCDECWDDLSEDHPEIKQNMSAWVRLPADGNFNCEKFGCLISTGCTCGICSIERAKKSGNVVVYKLEDI